MNESKCYKCGEINETFQRGQLITGTRCLACKYETISKIVKTVGDVKTFLTNAPEGARMAFEDDAKPLRLEAHFTGDISKTEQVKVWEGQ